MSLLTQVNNKLREFKVTINRAELLKESIKTIEMVYANTRPSVLGCIVIDDIYDLHSNIQWDSATVEVSYIDTFGEFFTKYFYVTDVNEDKGTMGGRVLALKIQDIFSHTLATTHISKGYNVDLVSALNLLSNEVSINRIPNFEYDYSSFKGSSNPIVLSKNVNALDYFTKEFYRVGYTFYQDKSGIHVKGLNDLIPNTLPYNGIFSDRAENEYYMNKIIESNIIANNTDAAGTPYRSSYFDPRTKSIVRDTNIPTESTRLNAVSKNLITGNSNKEVVQSRGTFEERELDLKRRLMDQTVIEISVSGYIKNDLNQIYELDLNGFKGLSKTQIEGNAVINGNYVSKQISEMIINDGLIQKITIHRSDESDSI